MQNGVEDESPVLINRTEWDNLNRELTRIHGLLGIGAEEKLVGGSQVLLHNILTQLNHFSPKLTTLFLQTALAKMPPIL